MRAFCLSVHLPELVYSTAQRAGSGLAVPGLLLLGARRGGTRAPRPWEAGVEPACVPRDDGRDVTYKGSPVANLCARISSFSICLSGWWFFIFFSPSSKHCRILASQSRQVREREHEIRLFFY